MKKLILFFLLILALGGFVLGGGRIQTEVDRYFINNADAVTVRFSDGTPAGDGSDTLLTTGEVFTPESGKKYVILTQGGLSDRDSVEFKYKNKDGKEVVFSNVEFEALYGKNPSGFIFENQELKYAEFQTKGDSSSFYELGDYKYEVPEGSRVIFKKGEDGKEDFVRIIQPAGTEVKPPEFIGSDDSKKGNLDVEYKTWEPGALITPGGKFQVLEKRTDGANAGMYRKVQSSIFYRYEDGKLRAYFKDSVAVFYNDKNEIDFSIFNPGAGSDNPEVDLIFEGTLVSGKRPSVLITDSQIGSSSPNGEGVVINLGGANRWGVGSEKDPLRPDKKTVSFQGIDGFAVLERGADGKIPTLKISGNSIYGPDRRSYFGKKGSNKFYWKNMPKIKLGNHGDGTTFLRVVGVDGSGNEFPFEIFSTNENSQVAVPQGKLNLIMGDNGYFVGKEGTVVSNVVIFNELPPKVREMFVKLPRAEQLKIITRVMTRGADEIDKILREYNSRGGGGSGGSGGGGGPGNAGGLSESSTSEEGVYNLVNRYRQEQDQRLGGLKLNPALTNKARWWSEQMAKNKYTHSELNYAENIHHLIYYREPSDEEVMQRIMNGEDGKPGNLERDPYKGGWMDSTGHRNNILNSGHTQMGVGIYHHIARDNYGRTVHHYYGTQLFSR